MIGTGRGAQYVMSDPMTYVEAKKHLEDLVDCFAEGDWTRIGTTYVNPRHVSTLRIVRERATALRFEEY
jgi:hypothetical protein